MLGAVLSHCGRARFAPLPLLDEAYGKTEGNMQNYRSMTLEKVEEKFGELLVGPNITHSVHRQLSPQSFSNSQTGRDWQILT